MKVSHPGFIGKTLVKVEFWRVTPEYLAHYPTALRSPIQPGQPVSRISNPVPAGVAALEFEYPSAILIGESVLHAAGWITQIPAQLSVAVLRRRSYADLFADAAAWHPDPDDLDIPPEAQGAVTSACELLAPTRPQPHLSRGRR